METPALPHIFDYLNYREFLRDYYAAVKRQNSCNSYSYLAQKAGFRSKSFIPHVVEGKKNLSRDSIYKIARTLKLDKKSFSYFEDLVAFNQATTFEQRTYFFSRLAEYNRRNQARVIQKRQYDFYARWYHNTIRELVTIVDFKEDYKILARMVRPSLTPRQAKESVQLLMKLGLIEKQNNRYIQTNRAITTGDEIAALAVLNFHVQNLALAAEQVSVCPSADRDISAMVVGLSAKGFRTIKEEIQSFRKRIADIVDQDQEAERVYHINFQLLPTSERMR